MSRRYALGIHIGHDRGSALVDEGTLVAHVSEERLDRQKHSNSPELPLRSIEAVLEIGRIQPSDLGVVGISYTNVKIDSIIPLLRDETRDVLGTPSLDVLGVSHHDCHAWSSYCTCDDTEALVLVADGSGDIIDDRIESESVYVGSGDSMTLIDRRLQDFGSSRMTRRNSFVLQYMIESDRKKDISLGNKYEQFTYLTGFGQREAGKMMGLAPYADPLFRPDVPVILGLQFPLKFETGLVEIDRIWRESGEPWHSFVSRRTAAIAASGQLLLEEYMLALLNALNPTGVHRTLCTAGGVFLNCQMNGRILRETKFQRLHVVPAAGDDGQSIGAAFYAHQQAFGAPRRRSDPLPYLGLSYDRSAIQAQLRRVDLNVEEMEDAPLIERMADALAQGRVIALLRGRSESGPRALCHRSMLADPRKIGMKDYLNRLKGREVFRPFAPAVTEEDQSHYFELGTPSQYMLVATRLRPRFHEALPAIVHVDGSSRVQAVSMRKEPFVHALLRAFEARTGYPVLLNTSFNLGGEPIVETPKDAIDTFTRSNIDFLVMENHFVSRPSPIPTPPIL
jgi:carbamoyltransferase